MPQLILHHYPASPFAKKVRLAFGIKGLAWQSVETAPLPPRPDLVPLTGGYRRIPVLQVGADIYCDTNIILPTLDRLCDGPSLYPDGRRGLDAALSFNFEREIWLAALGVAVHFKEQFPEDFLRDREEDYLYVDMSKAGMEPKFEANLQRMRAQTAWLAEALADGRQFLAGDAPSALDLAYFHPLWLIRSGQPKSEIDAALDLATVVPWFERVAAIRHGTTTKATAESALAAARDATPETVTHIAPGHLAGDPNPGDRVTVTPDDFARVPVIGTLVAADTREIVLHHEDPQIGDLHLHFPRAGFELKAA